MLKKIVPEVEFSDTILLPKEWQAEAFLSALLFCCRAKVAVKFASVSEYDWEFTRVCWLMNTYGNVFNVSFADKCRVVVGCNRSFSRKTKEFVNNLRLTPTDAKVQLFEICNELLKINPRQDEYEIKGILMKELME